jgi:hypothetical protein
LIRYVTTALLVFYVDFVRLKCFGDRTYSIALIAFGGNSFHLLFSPLIQENGALLDEKTFRGKYYNQYCGASKAG